MENKYVTKKVNGVSDGDLVKATAFREELREALQWKADEIKKNRDLAAAIQVIEAQREALMLEDENIKLEAMIKEDARKLILLQEQKEAIYDIVEKSQVEHDAGTLSEDELVRRTVSSAIQLLEKHMLGITEALYLYLKDSSDDEDDGVSRVTTRLPSAMDLFKKPLKKGDFKW